MSSIIDFLRKYWQTFVLIIGIAVCYEWVRYQQSGLSDTIKRLNDSHQLEIDQINAARNVENQQHELENKQYQESIAKIQANFDEAQKLLLAQQYQEQKIIVKKYANDNEGLANLLANRMHFSVIK